MEHNYRLFQSLFWGDREMILQLVIYREQGWF